MVRTQPRPTERAIAQLPPHLRRYVVDQDYAAYTARDQAVWRHILHRLTAQLADKAHESYLSGLAATGIGVERIPSLDEMNEKLGAFGWSAVAVRGFIPPAVFTELQSLGVLAIAADIRTHEHIEYTPAPDIVHESAGHAPILANVRYADYLKRSGTVGFKAIASVEDQAVFEAIRHLSVVKEDPAATAHQVQLAEERLVAASASRRLVSESTKASRLYWWTAEYGLIGDLAQPKLYGAGLLSSLGESSACLGPEVKKVPLSAACAEVDYDITRMQPQLFVARDFDHLFEVLGDFEKTLAWRRGGDYGLRTAMDARTVNHVVLGDGTELSGKVVRTWEAQQEIAPGLKTAAALLDGPIMRSRAGKAAGRRWQGQALVAFGKGTTPREGAFDLTLDSGVRLSGFAVGGHEVIRLQAFLGSRQLDVPTWCKLFVSASLPSVAGGPADPETWERWYGERDAFGEGDDEAKARAGKAGALSAETARLYSEVRQMRESGRIDRKRLEQIHEQAHGEWLLREEVRELLG